MAEAAYTVSEPEYNAAQDLARAGTPWTRARGRIWMVLIACASAWAIWQHLRDPADITLAIALLAPAFMVYCVLYVTFEQSSRRKAYILAAPPLTNLHVEVDEAGYHFEIRERLAKPSPQSASSDAQPVAA